MKFQSTALAFVAALTAAAADKSVLVKDIYPGPTSSNPIGMEMYDGKVYFAASGEGTGVELYVSDGETDGTMMLKDIFVGASGSNPSDFTVFDNKLFFRANDGINGSELWVTDGTAEGTTLFADISPGGLSSSPDNFVVVGDLMVFEATTAEFGQELWVTDGTPEGTVLLEDLQAGPGSSMVSLRSEYKLGTSMTLFTADDGISGEALYSTDGSAITYLVNVTSADEQIVIARPKEAVSEIFFSIGTKFYVTDGTVAGTTMLSEEVAVGGPSRISSYTLGGKTHFFGTDPASAVDSLWETDGTIAGTKAIISGLGSSAVSRRGSSATVGLGFGPVLNGKLSLITDNGVGVNVWTTDGTSLDLLFDETYDWVLDAELSMAGDQVLFQIIQSSNGTALDLWASDYSPLNTVLIASFPNGVSTSTGESVAISGNQTLFTVDTPETGVELWKMEFPALVTSPTFAPVSSPTRAPVSAPTPGPQPGVRSPTSASSRRSILGLGAMTAIVGSLVALL